MGKLLLFGVMMVKPRLLGLRLGGVGGFTKVGEAGAEVLSVLAASGNEAVETARLNGNTPDVLTARFFKLRAFLAGVAGCCISKRGALLGSVVRNPAISITTDDGEIVEAGDSGEGPGEGSVVDEESIVLMVLVGEESESEAAVDVLSWFRWYAGKAELPGLGLCVVSPLLAGVFNS